MRFDISGLLILFVALSCSGGNESTTTITKRSQDTTGDGNSDPSDSNSKDPGDSGDDGIPSPSDKEKEERQRLGRLYFTETVIPNFEANCQRCHADPRDNPTTPAPLTIFSHRTMLSSWLSQGGSSLTNKLIQKVGNLLSHQGGDLCGSDLSVGPCSTIITWWKTEFGNDEGRQGIYGAMGALSDVTALGSVYGYAGVKTDPSLVASINLYIDKPKGDGELIASLTADQAGFAAGISGNHAFKGDLPASYRDGKTRLLYAYAKIKEEEFQLQGSPFSFAAYTPTAEGQSYFNSSVRPALSGCATGGCHAEGFTYAGSFDRLVSPTPATSGSATNNQLINRVAGEMGHPRNFCNKVSGGSPCDVMRTWWGLEFTNN